MALGTRIKQARLSAGLTQAALARVAGVGERNIVRWENNQHAPRFEHVAAIAKATGRDVDYFTSVEPPEEDEEEAEPVALFGAAMQRMFDASMNRAAKQAVADYVASQAVKS